MGDDNEHEKCLYWSSFVGQQLEELSGAIAKTKGDLSQERGEDVGEMYARKIFLEKYLKEWALDFRMRYCTTICPLKGGCDFYKEHLKIENRKRKLEARIVQ